MKHNVLKHMVVALLIPTYFVANLAHAALITETWTGTVANTGSGHSAGSALSWTVTYDDASVSMDVFNDRRDGIAGTSDDTVRTTFSLADPLWASYSFFANATYDFNSIFTTIDDYISTIGASAWDHLGINYSVRYADNNGKATSSWAADSEMLRADIPGFALFSKGYQSSTGEKGVTGVALYNVSFTTGTHSVPELDAASAPLAILLIGGLLAAGFERRRKKVLGVNN